MQQLCHSCPLMSSPSLLLPMSPGFTLVPGAPGWGLQGCVSL